MAEFAYNKAKNKSTGHTSFELNCSYHFRIFYQEDINPRSKLKLIDKLWMEIPELITVYKENLHYT